MPGETPVLSILAADDGPAVDVVNAGGRGAFVFACEHASNFVPPALRNLGLNDDDLRSHIAWDPGALGLARRISQALDAPLVAARVSRLVFDCNRPPLGLAGIAASSENRVVPGNLDLTPAEVGARVREIYQPFRQALADVIDARADQRPVLVTIHSFTPVYFGQPRDVQLGILHDTDSRFADSLLRHVGAATGLDARRNQPYGPQDGVTHTLQEHGIARGLLNAMIEVRNDLLPDEHAIARVAAGLIAALRSALDEVRTERSWQTAGRPG